MSTSKHSGRTKFRSRTFPERVVVIQMTAGGHSSAKLPMMPMV